MDKKIVCKTKTTQQDYIKAPERSVMDILKEGGQYDLYGRVYGFLKKWANDLPKTDGEWYQVVQEADMLCMEYKGNALEALAASLVGGAVGELERLTRTQ